jgi:hypothetical protein
MAGDPAASTHSEEVIGHRYFTQTKHPPLQYLVYYCNPSVPLIEPTGNGDTADLCRNLRGSCLSCRQLLLVLVNGFPIVFERACSEVGNYICTRRESELLASRRVQALASETGVPDTAHCRETCTGLRQILRGLSIYRAFRLWFHLGPVARAAARGSATNDYRCSSAVCNVRERVDRERRSVRRSRKPFAAVH